MVVEHRKSNVPDHSADCCGDQTQSTETTVMSDFAKFARHTSTA